jgi:hypothetical protein
MINTTTSTLSALKAFATLHNIEIIGDKRKKASYQTSIDSYLFLNVEEALEVAATEYVVDSGVATETAERPMTTAAVPLIMMLGVTFNLVLWALEVSIATAQYTHRKGRKTTAWKAANTYFHKLGKDISQFTNGLVYGL